MTAGDPAAGRAAAPVVSTAAFAAVMSSFAPLPPDRRIAVAVSGGADSLALALLVARWAAASGRPDARPPLALVVDHALRPGSRAEAEGAAAQCARLGLAPRILGLPGLAPGPALQARARTARYAALFDACHEAGVLDLALGHHRADQHETIAMRNARSSGPIGAAGMAAVSERHGLRLLRPLLTVDPADLKATLAAAGIVWFEDPSNRDPRFDRARLRAASGQGPAPVSSPLSEARRAEEAEAADWLARHAAVDEAGYAILPDEPLPESALAALLRTIAGAEHPPPRAAVARLAAIPRPATLHGVRLDRAPARLGAGLIVFREARAMSPPSPLRTGVTWDGRFRLVSAVTSPQPGWTIGALGPDAARAECSLPAAVRIALPAIRDAEGRLQSIPLRAAPVPTPARQGEFEVIFAPCNPLAANFFTIPARS